MCEDKIMPHISPRFTYILALLSFCSRAFHVPKLFFYNNLSCSDIKEGGMPKYVHMCTAFLGSRSSCMWIFPWSASCTGVCRALCMGNLPLRELCTGVLFFDMWNLPAPCMAIFMLVHTCIDAPCCPSSKCLILYYLWIRLASLLGHFRNFGFAIRQRIKAGYPFEQMMVTHFTRPLHSLLPPAPPSPTHTKPVKQCRHYLDNSR